MKHHVFALVLVLCIPATSSAGDSSPIHPPPWDAAHAEHLLNRAGFGARTGDLERAQALGQQAFVTQLLDQRADVDPYFLDRYEEPPRRELRELNEPDRLKVQGEYREKDRRQLIEYTGWWMDRMLGGEDPLFERMVLFWHGLFTSSIDSVKNSYQLLQQDQLLRANALGNYGKLLAGIVKDPAMLTYLNNNVNRKDRPNENLARELMELFSLGIGNYTEKDIKEVARALTGRTTDGHGDYAYNASSHDDGEKTFLGATGKFDGDDVVRVILAQDACPRYIARRLITYFEGVEPSKERLQEYASFLRANDFEIKPFLRKLFLDPAFYRDEIIGTRVQGPVEFMVGMSRRLGLRTPPLVVAASAALLGQRVFAPPNVKGWDEGEAWITTSSLMQRGNLAGMLLGVVKIDEVISADDSDMNDVAMGEDAGAAKPASSEMTMQERAQKKAARKALDKQAGLKGAGSIAYQALRRVQDAGWAPNLNFSARLAKAGMKTDKEIVDRMLADLLAIPAPDDTRERLCDFLAGERVSLGLSDGALLTGEAQAERVLRRLAHLILSLPEAQLE